jgi:RNA polymerase sigma factor (sigma-70 family)
VTEAFQAVFRIETPRLVAALSRMVRDVGLAEELAQDAMLVALERWPADGMPDHPGAWLLSVARRRAIDLLRRTKLQERKHEELAQELSEEAPAQGDDMLSLMFVSCHPVLSPDARVALTLRLLGGLTTEEIARAYLVPEPTIAQRIVRAKKTLAQRQVPFEVPRGEELQKRLPSVLEVIYLIFNEGYSATAGGDWMRPALCEDALRLGRMLCELLPGEAEAHGLVALMALQASRMAARLGPSGEPILLADQDRGRWDLLLIRLGLESLARAEGLQPAPGPYALQAAIAACHARARSAAETDWKRIAELYRALGRALPTPVVELNRAVAVSMASGPAAALPLVEALRDELADYPHFAAVRGDLLERLGRFDEARAEFERAASLTRNERERQVLLGRAAKAGAS